MAFIGVSSHYTILQVDLVIISSNFTRMNLSMTNRHFWKKGAVGLVFAAVLVAAAYFNSSPAQAHTDPISCDSTGVTLSLTVLRADGVTPVGGGTVTAGETVKYRATLSWAGGSNCNYEGGDLDIITPDGANHDVDSGTIPLVSNGSPFIGTIVSYVVNSADIGGDNDLDASAVYSGGTSHLGTANVSPVGATTPAATTASGSITVDKVTDPSGSSQSFTFNTTGAGYSGFSLTDQATPNTQTLSPGSYSITEATSSGWTLSSANCAVNGATSTPYIPGTSLTLNGGDSILCTFNNTLDRGRIVIIKQTTPDATSTPFEFDPSWGSNFMLTDGQAATSTELVAGTYSIAEVNIPANWSMTSASCSDGSTLGNISLSAGETVTCTVNNTYTPPAMQWCSPGYWKQPHHSDSWVGYAPNQLFSSVFENAFPGLTLRQVLAQGGGGLNALGRHVVAQLLNASAGLSVGTTSAGVISSFNSIYPAPGGTNTNSYYGGFQSQFVGTENCPLN